MKRLNQTSQPQRGVTLIELLIGMLIGTILIGGVIQVYISNQETNRIRNSMAAISENAQFAFEHFNRHLRISDYNGDASIEFQQTGDSETLLAVIDEETVTDGEVEYTLENNAISFNDDLLINGVSDWVIHLGIGDESDGSIQYELAQPGLYEDVWSIRIELVLLDPLESNQPLTVANGGRISTTIAVRNPVFQVAAQNLTPVAGGGAVPPSGDQDTDTDPDQGSDDSQQGDEQQPGDNNDGDADDANNDDGTGDGDFTGPNNATCSCFYKNSNKGYSLVDDNQPQQCTSSCCEQNDTGNGNNRSFAVNAGLCS